MVHVLVSEGAIYIQASMELGPEDVSLSERCLYFMIYSNVQASIELKVLNRDCIIGLRCVTYFSGYYHTHGNTY